MTVIDAKGKYFSDLNAEIKNCGDGEIVVDNCNGQRYIGSGLENKILRINGVPGNALGAYLNNCDLYVNGNAQDATGDTMNGGRIYIYGNSGDATGYAMRGGAIYIKGGVGYRAGVHIKSYKELRPVIVAGGGSGNFLGEYQAGGVIILLNLENRENPAGDSIANGMHGGEIFIRGVKASALGLSPRLVAENVGADAVALAGVSKHIEEFARVFGFDFNKIMESKFLRITPNTRNPYKQLYVNN
ncbi:MAG: glutamate synthase [Clostridiales bacterium]|jgi:glutamate synthase domain-containing protein 3|nr:glutamate synthase [Clostridiales bacterium]